MSKPRKPEYFAPVGIASYPWLNKPDTKSFNGEENPGVWKLDMRYEATDPNWVKFKAQIDKLVNESYAEAQEKNPKKAKQITKKSPYFMETTSDGEETGNVILRLKQNAFIPDKKTGELNPVWVALFDRNLEPIDRKETLIYAGSKVHPKFTTRNYYVASSAQAGINLDLKAVQVIKLVSGGGGRSAESYGYERYEDDEDDDGMSHNDETPDEAAQDPTDF